MISFAPKFFDTFAHVQAAMLSSWHPESSSSMYHQEFHTAGGAPRVINGSTNPNHIYIYIPKNLCLSNKPTDQCRSEEATFQWWPQEASLSNSWICGCYNVSNLKGLSVIQPRSHFPFNQPWHVMPSPYVGASKLIALADDQCIQHD